MLPLILYSSIDSVSKHIWHRAYYIRKGIYGEKDK